MNMRGFIVPACLAVSVLITLAVGAFGEEPVPFTPFEKGGYEDGSFDVTSRTILHGMVTVKVTEAKRLGPRPQEPPYVCRAWLEADAGERTVLQRYFDDIAPAGFSYGLAVPRKMPSPRYVAVVKNGDFDGRLYLIDRNGTVFDLPGGFYFVTADGRYLFSEYVAEAQEVVVFDLVAGKVVLDTSAADAFHLPGEIYDWYYDGKRYFFTIVKGETNSKGMVVEDRKALFEVNLAHPGIDRVTGDFSRLFHKKWDFDPRAYKDCAIDPAAANGENAGSDR